MAKHDDLKSMRIKTEEEIAAMLNPSPSGVCQRCVKRPATKWWTEGTVAFVHGMKAAWCDRCVIEEQLKFARERAAAIPELEAQLAKTDAADDGPPPTWNPPSCVR